MSTYLDQFTGYVFRPTLLGPNEITTEQVESLSDRVKLIHC